MLSDENYYNKHAGAVRIFILAPLFLFLISSCREVDPFPDPEPGEELSGGQVTVFDAGPNAFGHQAPGLTGLDELEFFVGNSFFNQNWVSSPASTTARDGLGPLFNARACSGCHFKDGRGRPPEFIGETGTGLLLRLGNIQIGVVQGDPNYGGQLQDLSLPDVPTEGSYTINYEEISGTFSDGTRYNLRKPNYTIHSMGYGPLDPDNLISPRVANQMIGLGLLEAIPEDAILAQVDESDVNGDGISGRANWVPNVETGNLDLGRFGWKSNQPNLRQQSAGAFIGDMGITTSLFTDQNCTSVQTDCQNAPDGGQPEITDDDLRKVVLYVSTLAVPIRRDWDQPDVLKGKETFMEIGCAGCHTPSWETGTHPNIDALSHQKIWPYTDLLLHDMGDGLGDNFPNFEATGNEWRTPPLWGIGLFSTVNDHTYYLHDGRARNLTEAILWHGGEAEASKDKFRSLSEEERDRLILFLNTL